MSALRTVPGNLSSQRQGIQGRHEGIFGGFAGRTADFTCCSPLFFFRLQKHRKPNAKIPEEENPYLPELPLEERRRRLKERFGELDIRDFACGYNRQKFLDEGHIRFYQPEYDEKISAIFCLMHKETEESRSIDCHSCGYSSCLEMATAIARGYNRIENCVHYVKDENFHD